MNANLDRKAIILLLQESAAILPELPETVSPLAENEKFLMDSHWNREAQILCGYLGVFPYFFRMKTTKAPQLEKHDCHGDDG